MGMKAMTDLRNMLCDELEEIVGTGHITGSDLESVHKLTDTIKNIDKIERMEEEGYSYGSYDGDWKASGTYSNGNNRGYSGRHYVRGHYSNAGDDMVRQRMEDMMSNRSMSSEDRNAVKRTMEMLR